MNGKHRLPRLMPVSPLALLVGSALTLGGNAEAGLAGGWKSISLTSGPNAREGHTVVYDLPRQRMIVFGGRTYPEGTFLNDLWELSLDCLAPEWTALSPVGGPPEARAFHAAIYDRRNDRMIVFAGENGGGVRQDVWQLKLDTLRYAPRWSRLAPTGTQPCKRSGHVAIYDPNNQRMLIYGGMVLAETSVDDTWALTLPGIDSSGAWSEVSKDKETQQYCQCPTHPPQLHCNGQPEPRTLATAIYDPRSCEGSSGRMLLINGCDPQDTGSLGRLDCLPWDFTRWFPLSGPPTNGFGQSTVRDLASGDRALVFGGATGSFCDSGSAGNGLWELDLDNLTWTDRGAGAGAPPPRYFHSAIFDSVYNRMVVFGGRGEDGSALGDIWVRDYMPPGAISDLTIGAVGTTTAILSWTAPGDDGNCNGPAAECDLRYSTAGPITESNFSNAQRVWPGDVPTPEAPGTLHDCVAVDSLALCTWHYFAIKTQDNAGLWSSLSNTPTVQTNCSGREVYCEDAGLFAQSWSDTGWVTENTLRWVSAPSPAMDLCAMRGIAGPIRGVYHARVTEVASGPADIDQVGLGVVDHEPVSSAFVSDGSILLGTTAAVEDVRDVSGMEVRGLAGETGDGPYRGTASQTLLVTLGGGQTANSGLVIESSGDAPGIPVDSTGILVQAPGADETWTTLAHIHPRRLADFYAVEAQGNSVLRLVFLADHTIGSLRRLTVTATQTPQALQLIRADHSRSGDVSDAVRSTGEGSIALLPGDALELGFAATPVPADKARDFFLQVRGARAAQPMARGGEAAVLGLPGTFALALGPPRPNPSTGRVTIGFTMAQQGHASIRIYDVAGRLLTTLVDEAREPGPQSVVWSATDDDGRRLSAGVYYCRMVVGSWSSQKKMIFLQR